MKKFLSKVILLFICTGLCFGYVIKFKEDYYNLYHIHHQQLPDDCIENIYWLERAVEADFANPQYARNTTILNQIQWEKYRYLFMMHINLKLIEQHLRLGRIYDKKVACFFDAPWKDAYLHDLDKAQSCYEAGLYYWREARLWSEKANDTKFRFLFLQGLDAWQDESYRIAEGELDYEAMLNRELNRIKKVKADFEKMGYTY